LAVFWGTASAVLLSIIVKVPADAV
jgi:hypothetical protein